MDLKYRPPSAALATMALGDFIFRQHEQRQEPVLLQVPRKHTLTECDLRQLRAHLQKRRRYTCSRSQESPKYPIPRNVYRRVICRVLAGLLGFWARGKRRGFSPGASRAPQGSDQSFGRAASSWALAP